jgi:steroid 5-alpha reductase family enzyme
MSQWSQFLVGLLAMAVLFAVAWAGCVRARNYGFLDVMWSYGLALLAPFYAWQGRGDPLRKWLFAGVGIVWSLRLGTHILRRVARLHPQEDARYRSFRARWPSPALFLGFFELQAAIVSVLSLPFLFACANPGSPLGGVEVAGLALSLLAVGGEALSDWQLDRFKADPAHAGQICRAGLWSWSRHPNYFFESMVWWGFFVAALGSPHGWITVFCPLLMLHFLLRVTGIPLTEEFAVKSKGDAYRDYQRTTSAFIPLPPKTT